MKCIPFIMFIGSLTFAACSGESSTENAEDGTNTEANVEALTTAPSISLNDLFNAYRKAVDINDSEAQSNFKAQLSEAVGESDHPIIGAFFDENTASPDAAVASEILQENFSQLTDQSTGLLDRGRSLEFLNAVRINAMTNPTDNSTAEWVFKSAEVAQSIGDFNTALALYQQILAQFPEGARAPDATFMIAFTYDENFQDFETAKTYYELFLENYPEDDFADDAQMMLQLLGKSDAEVLESLGQ